MISKCFAISQKKFQYSFEYFLKIFYETKIWVICKYKNKKKEWNLIVYKQ